MLPVSFVVLIARVLVRTFTPQLLRQPSRFFLCKNGIPFDCAIYSCSTATNSLACMRSADISVLQAANLQVARSDMFGQYTFVPVVDGSFITRRPTELLKEGRVNGVRDLP